MKELLRRRLEAMGFAGRVMKALLGRDKRTCSTPSSVLNESDGTDSGAAHESDLEEREDGRERGGGTKEGIEKRCILAIATASALAADAATTAVKAARHMVRLRAECERRKRSSSIGRIRPMDSYIEVWKHCAAVKIQAAFRGFLARKAYRALRGLVKLQALVRGCLVRKQTNATLRAMQALIRVQSCVRAHRLRIFEQGQAVQVSNYSREVKPFAYERRWCDKQSTTGEIQTKLQQRQESSVKRECTRVDGFSSQVKVRRNKISVRITPPNPYPGEHLNKFSEYISTTCSSIGTPTRIPFSPHNATSCTSSVSNMHKRVAGKPSMLPGYMASTECYKAKCRSSSLGDLKVPKEARRRNASHDLTLHDVSSENDGYSSISVNPPPDVIPSVRDGVVQAFRRAQL